MKKVLLVDDEQDFSYFVKKNLEASGDYQIEVCNDSLNAFDAAKKLKPDIILLDIKMPNKSGTDIAAELKEDKATQNIPFVFLTAIVKQEEADKNANYIGGEYFIAKPVRFNEIISAIDKFLPKE
jgi:CheY-like chemotaxis protein